MEERGEMYKIRQKERERKNAVKQRRARAAEHVC